MTTYLDAAFHMLHQARQPLRYETITERALAQQMISPQGLTPETTKEKAMPLPHIKLFRRPVPLRRKVTVITGASAGIGRATAQAFAAEGARLVLAARREKALYQLAAELKPHATDCLVMPTDLTSDADLERLVAETKRVFGRIDILVNNAGLGNGGALHEMPADELHTVLQVNLHGTFRLTQLALPILLEQRHGQIINVSSVAAKLFVPGLSVYSATKAAIVAFSACLRRELAGSGICVTTVIPGITRTAMIAGAMEAFFSTQENRTPVLNLLSRAIYEPETVARVIVDAARYRKREVLMGGIPMMLVSGLETATPRLADFAFSRGEVSGITTLMLKMGAP